jgi:very-short-patch-repair endonuclease
MKRNPRLRIRRPIRRIPAEKPIGIPIVDFYSPKVKLVIEVDISQHLEPNYVQKELARKNYLQTQGLLVLRFDTLQVLQKTDEVMEKIYGVVATRLGCDEQSL